METGAGKYSLIGKPVSRIVGKQKVSGAARYTADINADHLLYGILLTSTIAAGRVTHMHTSRAEALPGVVRVFTHLNFPKTGQVGLYGFGGRGGSTFSPLQNDEVRYAGQIIGLVVAETLEIAEYAASVVEVAYEPTPAKSDLIEHLSQAIKFESKGRGNLKWGNERGKIKIDATYTTHMLFHIPLEPPATLALWSGNQLTVYESTQWVKGVQAYLGHALQIPTENIRVILEFVGGGFGVKGTVWFYTAIAALAAKEVGRPLKLLPTREQMYSIWGHRPVCYQQLSIAATAEGKLTAYKVTIHSDTSVTDTFGLKASVEAHLMIHNCPNAKADLHLVPLHFNTPTPMRAPGECEAHLGHSLIIDELAATLGKDPMEIYLLNYADKNYQTNQSWTSKELKKCLKAGAERFGWAKRAHQPRSMRDKESLVGWGMAIGAYPVYISPSMAKMRLHRDGKAEVLIGSQSIGTGNYTIAAQIAAQTLRTEMSRISVRLGDTDLPAAPIMAGSRTTASIIPCIEKAAQDAIEVLLDLAASTKGGPLYGHKKESLALQDGYVYSKEHREQRETISDILDRSKLQYIEGYGEYLPPGAKPSDRNRMAVGSEVVVGPEFDNRSAYAYSAIFAEVKVSPHTGMYKITRVVGAYDCGRIVNPKTAISQCKGGIIMGISYACREETAIDHRLHRIVNNNFADYHIAVQADIPPIDVLFIEEPDPYVGSLGIKGLGKLLSVEYQLPLPMHFFMQPVSAYVGFLLLLKNYSSYNSS